MALFLSVLSALTSIVASYLWFKRYTAGRAAEQMRTGLAEAYYGGDQVGISLVSLLLPTWLRRIWHALIIAAGVCFFGLLHWFMIRSFWDGGSFSIKHYLVYAGSLALWVLFLAFPAWAIGEIVLRYRAAKVR